jgi:hypothetical protein
VGLEKKKKTKLGCEKYFCSLVMELSTAGDALTSHLVEHRSHGSSSRGLPLLLLLCIFQILQLRLMGSGICWGRAAVAAAVTTSIPTVVVIGAGFGGLAAACFLQNSHFKVFIKTLNL